MDESIKEHMSLVTKVSENSLQVNIDEYIASSDEYDVSIVDPDEEKKMKIGDNRMSNDVTNHETKEEKNKKVIS
eukprot:2777617-Ditylum_brightwellii.AAC.1